MTSSTENPMEAVTALLQERKRFEGWLDTLESRRASTPGHVYERVRADYETRLQEVLDQLATRTSALQARIDELRAEVERVQGEEDARRDARTEAELRALVGEHTPEAWEEIRRRADDEIARLSGERESVASELEQVQQMLAVATAKRGSTPPMAPSVAREPSAPSPAAQRADGAERPGRTESPGAKTGTGPAAANFDELAFLKSVVGRADTDGPPAVPPSMPQPDLRDPFSDLADLGRSPTPPGSATVGASRSGRAPATPPRGNDVPRAGGQSSTAGRRPVTDGVPAFLKDVPAEQVKTLKCQECGTMNYPTEWYCERCGGELAAM